MRYQINVIASVPILRASFYGRGGILSALITFKKKSGAITLSALGGQATTTA